MDNHQNADSAPRGRAVVEVVSSKVFVTEFDFSQKLKRRLKKSKSGSPSG